jgi:predicted  nucleic acid-binding Zn-ribbon protein
MPVGLMKSTIFTIILLVCLFSAGCALSRDFDAHLNPIVKPYLFSIARWELNAIPHEVNQWLFGRQEKIDDEIRVVTKYFSFLKQVKTLKSRIRVANAGSEENDLALLEAELNKLQEQQMTLKGKVERIIEKQIRNTLTEQDIFNPVTEEDFNFPPLDFRLEELPHLLVISPRDRIDSVKEVILEQNLLVEDKESIEHRVDDLGVSSLVVEIGGIATYPSLVDSQASLRFTIETTTEEWLHQYLAFKPLGFLYLLDLSGIARNYDIATMNESLAGIVSKEIGDLVYEKYYSEYDTQATPAPVLKPEFDFNTEMRDIRIAVDAYLSSDEIEMAEEFMEQRRKFLVTKGYHIRKLNQAYFAFHGTYADSPAFISSIGEELKELRNRSSSLKDFLSTVASMTNRQDLSLSVR